MNSKICKFFISLILTSFLFVGCNENKKDIEIFYNKPNAKLWKHRVNCIKNAKKYVPKFPGIEVDVTFDEATQSFICGHGEGCGNILLKDLFDSLKDIKNIHYWLDFKNLNVARFVDSSKKVLNKLLLKYELKNKCFIESNNLYCLNQYKNEGIFTSYWVPEISIDTADKNDKNVLFHEIDSFINQTKPNALSAHYSMFLILKRNYPKMPLHIYTNGLKSEHDKNIIKEIANYKNTKVILIDYKEPF